MAELYPDENPLLSCAAELYAANPDLLVLGSVARAAVMGSTIDPYRPSGVLRDIDVIRMGNRGGMLSTDSVEVDTIFEDWIAEDGSYLVFPHDPSLSVPVRHPEVFSPYIRNIQGISIPTPHHDVLGKISTMQFIQRPKDKRAAIVYDAYLQSVDDHLPEELLKPFDEMRTALSQRRGYRARAVLRNGYHRTVPEPTRHAIHLGERLHWLRKH